ncbi:MAG: hypothetical protein KGQ83_09865 [Planctomycetes bacterium]|nr:hypothetical protein [Planctomycetota bacterium]
MGLTVSNIDTSPAGIKRGKMLWGAMPLPAGSQLLGSVRRAEDQGEEALILMPIGITVGGNAGVIKPLPPLTLSCLRCDYTWPLRGTSLPHNCPSCNSPYWDKSRRK